VVAKPCGSLNIFFVDEEVGVIGGGLVRKSSFDSVGFGVAYSMMGDIDSVFGFSFGL